MLKGKLKEKKDALVALKERIEAGDEEAIREAGELTEEIEALEQTIKAANIPAGPKPTTTGLWAGMGADFTGL